MKRVFCRLSVGVDPRLRFHCHGSSKLFRDGNPFTIGLWGSDPEHRFDGAAQLDSIKRFDHILFGAGFDGVHDHVFLPG